MGSRFFSRVRPALALLLLMWAAPAWAAPEKVFRLAVVQANPYWSYSQTLEYVREYLREAGWGERTSFPDELHFVWGGGGESGEDHRQKAREILDRDDCDLILSFGTTATRALLAENENGRPIVGLAISNPLAAGFIAGTEHSGSERFTTVTYKEQPGRYMFILFHELMKFKSMGFMYHDGEDARQYTYLEEAREVARERGFELVEHNGLGAEEALEDCARAARELMDRGAEALFIPNIRCFDSKTDDLRPIFEDIYERKILTFASEDREMVRDFALAGLIFSDVASQARFQADQIIQILSGRSPGQVDMLMPFNSRIMLNLAAAERLGLKLSIKMLTICDEIYMTLPGLSGAFK